MGTDIHGGFIKVVKDKFGNVVSKQPIKTNWNFDRNYTLFAFLQVFVMDMVLLVAIAMSLCNQSQRVEVFQNLLVL